MSQLIDYNQEGKELLNATLDSMKEGVMWISENGKILEINKSLLQTLGYSFREAYGLLIYEVDISLNRMLWEKQIKELERKKQISINTHFITSKGNFFSVQIIYSLVNYDGLYFVSGVVRNELEEKRYKKLLDLSSDITPMGVWMWDNIQKKLTTNKPFFDILELPFTDTFEVQELTLLVQKCLDDKSRSLVVRGLHQLQTEGRVFNERLELRFLSQKKKNIHLQAKAITVNGRVTAIEGTIQDLDNRSTSSEELKVSKFALDKSADMVFWIDSNARIKYANEAVTNLLGYSQEELMNMKVFDFVPDFKIVQWRERWKQLQEELVIRIEGYNICKDGKIIPVESYMNYLNYQGKEYNCVSSRDISSTKNREAALKIALKEVENLKDKLLMENSFLKAEQEEGGASSDIISKSDAYHKVLKQLGQVAVTDATVLITGETGTGKELLARAVHNWSSRNRRTLVKVNCAALPENLIESELFGHEKGAFTGAVEQKIGRFELADEGTIFLDEIGELPLDLQAKLLRVLQEGEFERLGNSDTMKVDVRIIAATNRNLAQLIKEGKFREDLYYRLNVFPIENMPLRNRKEDIPHLVEHFINKFSNRVRHSINGIQTKALKKLMAYDFPGNIRELENIVERAIILSKGSKINLDHWLPQRKSITDKEKDFLTFDEMQKQHIILALKKTKWRVSGPYGAAKILGMNSKTLESKMRKFEISRKDFLL